VPPQSAPRLALPTASTHWGLLLLLLLGQVFEGMIEAFDLSFDVALALHACGNATDHVLQLAAAQGAAFIVSPCCVGERHDTRHL
jgi:hypothetical protein